MVGHEPLIMTSASGALLNQDQQVLLQARADTGDWGFPGGYMEYGESFSDTVKREFKEDAGFEIIPEKLLKLQDQDFYTYPVIRFNQLMPFTSLNWLLKSTLILSLMKPLKFNTLILKKSHQSSSMTNMLKCGSSLKNMSSKTDN